MSSTEEIQMARVEIPAGEGREASRIWQLAPLMGVGMAAMGKAMYEDSSLPVRLREVARMRIAQLNECSV
jgi:alkylhydroperoxidase family enzyme